MPYVTVPNGREASSDKGPDPATSTPEGGAYRRAVVIRAPGGITGSGNNNQSQKYVPWPTVPRSPPDYMYIVHVCEAYRYRITCTAVRYGSTAVGIPTAVLGFLSLTKSWYLIKGSTNQHLCKFIFQDT